MPPPAGNITALTTLCACVRACTQSCVLESLKGGGGGGGRRGGRREGARLKGRRRVSGAWPHREIDRGGERLKQRKRQGEGVSVPVGSDCSGPAPAFPAKAGGDPPASLLPEWRISGRRGPEIPPAWVKERSGETLCLSGGTLPARAGRVPLRQKGERDLCGFGTSGPDPSDPPARSERRGTRGAAGWV